MAFPFLRFALPNRNPRDTSFRSLNISYNSYHEIQFLDNHESIVRFLLKINEERFASASESVIIIWSYVTGSCLHILKGQHKNPVTCIMKSEPGRGRYNGYVLLISASSDHMICLWNIDNGQCLGVLQQHKCAIRCMAMLEGENEFIAAGQHIAVWSEDFKYICMHERLHNRVDVSHAASVNTSFLVCAVDTKLEVYLLSKSQDIVEMHHLRLYRKLPYIHRDTIRVLKSFKDKSKLFISASLDGMIVVWSGLTLSVVNKLNFHRNYVGSEKMFPYSVQDFIVVNNFLFAAIGNGWSIIDLVSGKTCINVKHGNLSKILHISMTNNYHLLTCSEDGRVKIWGFCRKHMKEDNYGTMKLFDDFAPIESTCMEITQGNSLHMQKLQACLIAECVGHSGSAEGIISFKDQGFVSCGTDGLVIIWRNGHVEAEKRTKSLKVITKEVDAITPEGHPSLASNMP